MKIVFLILNHRGPAQLVRLLTTLRSQLPESPIVVHHDNFHGEIPDELIEPIDNVHLLTSGKRVAWGDFSLVDVTWWSLRWIREHLEFDWLVLLSAQDYPIKPLGDFVDYLSGNRADAIISANPVSELPAFKRMLMRRRYLYQYQSTTDIQIRWLPFDMQDALQRLPGAAILALNNLQPLFKIYRLPGHKAFRIGRRAWTTPFSRSSPCWYGSQWFALSRGALEHVLNYMADHPAHVDYYRRTLIPDESMIATFVCNSPNMRVANLEVTYTRWANSTISHPDTFLACDFDELAAAPQHFARKFDIDMDSGILDTLDKYIASRASTQI